jgi:hypothetical protein
MINEFTRMYDIVFVFCKNVYNSTISGMYCDNPKVRIIPVENDTAALKFIEDNRSFFTDIKIIGFNYLNPNSNLKFEEQFYLQAGIEFNKKWNSFKIGRNNQKEKILQEKIIKNKEYLFVHDDFQRNMKISSHFLQEKEIIKANETYSDNILDFCSIIEEAKEIHVIDSCFMFLIDCLNYTNESQKLFVHRYSRHNDNWLLPKLKKNWLIITNAPNQ